MLWPEGSEHDAPLPTGEPSHGELDAPRMSEPTGKHLYLVFDDWPWGYSIRKLNLPPRVPLEERSLRPLEQRRFRRFKPHRPVHKHLPPPCIRLEAMRRAPVFFGAIGKNIIAAQHRNDEWNAPVPKRIMPIFDVCSLGVRFGPELRPIRPVFITVGDKLFALDTRGFSMLSMKPFYTLYDWSWWDLPMPPFESWHITSFAVDSDGCTIVVSTESATFAFDIVNSEWKQSSDCSLPFTGPANYVHALDIFVGLSKARDTYGHLCFCRKLGGDENVRTSKENLLSMGPTEVHEGATLLYLGGSEPGFCLVECVSIINKGDELCDQLVKCVGEWGGNCGELDQLKKNVDEGDGASGSMQECGALDLLQKFMDEGDLGRRFLYRLTTFSLSFDSNGDLTTGKTCVVQRYKVPHEVSEAIYLANPVAFWL